MAKSREAASSTPWLLYAGVAAVAGSAAWLYTAQAQAAPGLPAPGPPVGTTTGGTGGSGPGASAGPIVGPGTITGDPAGSLTTAQWRALVARLAARDATAVRQVFALQAAMYSLGLYTGTPDGLTGPLTTGAIRALATSLGRTGTNASVAMAYPWVVEHVARFGFRVPLSLPFTLPAALRDQINADAGRLAAGFPVLQVMPSESHGWRP